MSRNWVLEEIICCPMCKGEVVLDHESYLCGKCETRYPILGGVPLMIPHASATSVCPDGNVSTHPYSPNALEIVQRFEDGLVLDLGSGGKTTHYPNVVQLDIFRFPRVDVIAGAESLPFKDGIFDAVISQAVFEHLRHPEMAAQEIYRVCKPGAIIKIDTAFLQPVHGYPNHYFNATLPGLKHWFSDFSIEWEGVEDYQHPSLALDWILRSYMDGMTAEESEIFQNSTIKELISTIAYLSNGEGRENRVLQASLTNISPDKKKELAAGVSILARKEVADGRGRNFDRQAIHHVGHQDVRAEAKIARLESRLNELERLLESKHALLMIKNEVEDAFNREFLHAPISLRRECPWLAVLVKRFEEFREIIKKRLNING